jgi:glycosyltransferase involved in cell wall biosynthesis
VGLHGFDPADRHIPEFPINNFQSMKCRLLYLVGQLCAGGLERQLYYLLSAIDRQRYAPVVAVWTFRGDEFYIDQLRDMGVPVHFPPSGTSRPSKLRWFRSLANQLRPEVIHSYSLHTNLAASYAAAGTKAIAVGSVRSDFSRLVKEYKYSLEKLSLCWPRAQIFNSFSAADTAKNAYSPFTPRQVFVVRNGIDLDCFVRTPLPKSSPATVVAIGSLIPLKRWDRLLNAAFKLKQMQFKFRVQIVGDGPLRRTLERQADELKIKDRVEFIGQQNNIPAFLSDALLLAHASGSEGCPNVIMEAMACGRPVVATDAGDIPFLVEDGKTGFVVRQDDTNALAERIAALLQNRSLCERMSEAARVKAQQEFGLKRLLRETLAAYRMAGWHDESESVEPNRETAPVQISTLR